MLNRIEVLKYFFVKAIKDTISDEIAGNTLIIQDIKRNNQDFVDRVFLKFIEYTTPVFSLEEVLEFLRELLAKVKK